MVWRRGALVKVFGTKQHENRDGLSGIELFSGGRLKLKLKLKLKKKAPTEKDAFRTFQML